MYLPNSGNQAGTHRSYRADGVLQTSSPQLVLPQALSRAFLSIENISSNILYIEHGCARATATINNGAVVSLTILNPGFGFILPPIVEFSGGGDPQYPTAAPLTASNWDGRGQPAWPTPQGFTSSTGVWSRPARAIAVLSGGSVASFVIEDGGAGYVYAPEVFLTNAPGDPFGCADPSYGGGSGIQLASAGNYFLNGTFCHTDAIALYNGGGSSNPYYLEYAP